MEKAVSTVGILISPLSAVAVAVPYLLLPAAETPGLAQYYGFGLVTPWVAAIGGLVAAVAFAGGRAGNTDPETVAGAVLAVGVVMTVIVVQWALSVDVTVLQSITSVDWMANHRWAVVGATVPVPVVAAAYAWSLDLF
jgi:hypothetical protein